MSKKVDKGEEVEIGLTKITLWWFSSESHIKFSLNEILLEKTQLLEIKSLVCTLLLKLMSRQGDKSGIQRWFRKLDSPPAEKINIGLGGGAR